MVEKKTGQTGGEYITFRGKNREFRTLCDNEGYERRRDCRGWPPVAPVKTSLLVRLRCHASSLVCRGHDSRMKRAP